MPRTGANKVKRRSLEGNVQEAWATCYCVIFGLCLPLNVLFPEKSWTPKVFRLLLEKLAFFLAH